MNDEIEVGQIYKDQDGSEILITKKENGEFIGHLYNKDIGSIYESFSYYYDKDGKSLSSLFTDLNTKNEYPSQCSHCLRPPDEIYENKIQEIMKNKKGYKLYEGEEGYNRRLIEAMQEREVRYQRSILPKIGDESDLKLSNLPKKE